MRLGSGVGELERTAATMSSRSSARYGAIARSGTCRPMSPISSSASVPGGRRDQLAQFGREPPLAVA